MSVHPCPLDIHRLLPAALSAPGVQPLMLPNSPSLAAFVFRSCAVYLRVVVYAKSGSNPSAVYSAAEIDSPTVAREVDAPGKVKQLAASLDSLTGAPVLRWKGNNPRGGASVTYMIARRLAGESGFSVVGTAPPSGPGRRTFADTTLPIGTAAVSYTVHAVRGAKKGEPAQIEVRFGSVGSRIAGTANPPGQRAAA